MYQARCVKGIVSLDRPLSQPFSLHYGRLGDHAPSKQRVCRRRFGFDLAGPKFGINIFVQQTVHVIQVSRRFSVEATLHAKVSIHG